MTTRQGQDPRGRASAPDPEPAPGATPGVGEDSATDGATIADNLARVHARVAAAATRAGRDPGEVQLLPVSKTVPAGRVRHALAAGEHRFGENKVQEARRKAEALVETDIRWSVIGHLQTNKAKYVARFAAEVQSLDRTRLAHTLDRRLQAEGRGLDVLIQVNTSGEASKYGVAPEQAAALVRAVQACDALRMRGLMTLAIFSHDVPRVRACFSRLRALRERLQQEVADGAALATLSMGMSHDYEVAIAEGATEVRVGQAIFGPRPLPDSHYWPDDADA